MQSCACACGWLGGPEGFRCWIEGKGCGFVSLSMATAVCSCRHSDAFARAPQFHVESAESVLSLIQPTLPDPQQSGEVRLIWCWRCSSPVLNDLNQVYQ